MRYVESKFRITDADGSVEEFWEETWNDVMDKIASTTMKIEVVDGRPSNWPHIYVDGSR